MLSELSQTIKAKLCSSKTISRLTPLDKFGGDYEKDVDKFGEGYKKIEKAKTRTNLVKDTRKKII